MSCTSLIFRRPIPDDWERVVAVLPSWWDGRDLRALLPKVFFEHFRGTSLLVEHEDTLVAFLVGFFCARPPRRGLHPLRRRGAGVAPGRPRRATCTGASSAWRAPNGRSVVRAVTAPVNTGSIAFHTALGFSLLPGDDEVDGVPVTLDQGPHGRHLVRFQLFLEPEVLVVSSQPTVSPAGPRPVPAGRITDDEALALLEGGDLLGAGARADAVRRRLHPGDEVTFVVDRNINYTDYCLSGCRFCAFYKKPGSGEGYLLAEADIHRKIEETLELGGTAIMMQGGLHPDLDICWFEEVFSGIKARYPIHIHSLSPPEIVHIAKQSDLSVEETLTRLHAAGLDSLPGGGAEVLVDRVRTAISPHKIPTDTWLNVMRVGARPRHEDHGDHDVRLARHAGRAHRAPAPHPRPAGRDRRLHRVHPVDVPGRQHGAAGRPRPGHGRRLPR